MDYYNLNLLEEAGKVLRLSPDAAMIDYWQGISHTNSEIIPAKT